MKRIVFLAVYAAMFSACAGKGTELLVGTYTTRGGDGIYSARFDERSGRFSRKKVFSRMVNPSYICIDGDDVLAVSETSDALASMCRIHDGVGGSFMLTGGEDPCYIATDGTIALTANYTGGSLSVFKDGVRTQLIKGSIGGPDPVRQESAHVHCCVFAPDGAYVLATDFSADRILRFKIECDSLRLVGATPLERDCGPRHLLFADENTVYAIGELSGNITVLRYSDGGLEPLQTIEADPAHTRASADIRISPDGRFLYASNRKGMDGVAVFRVLEGGLLEFVDYTRTTANPRNIALSPEGRFLLVASQDEDKVEVYSRDLQTGKLARTSETLEVSMPVCLLFTDNK